MRRVGSDRERQRLATYRHVEPEEVTHRASRSARSATAEARLGAGAGSRRTPSFIDVTARTPAAKSASHSATRAGWSAGFSEHAVGRTSQVRSACAHGKPVPGYGFQPLRVKGVELRGRLVSSSASSQVGQNRLEDTQLAAQSPQVDR